MFKRGSLVMTIWNLIVAAGLIALGIATCVNYANEDFRNVMIMIAGIYVIVDAGLRILSQVFQVIRFQKGLLLRSDVASAGTIASELAVGILLIMVSQQTQDIQIVLKYLILFVSILLITMGAVALIYAIVFLVKKVGAPFRNIVALIIGALLIVGGVLILVYATNEAMLQFIFIMLGIGFMVSGIALAIVAISFAVLAKRAAAVAKEEKPSEEPADAIETEVSEKEPEEEEKPSEEPKEE